MLFSCCAILLLGDKVFALTWLSSGSPAAGTLRSETFQQGVASAGTFCLFQKPVLLGPPGFLPGLQKDHCRASVCQEAEKSLGDFWAPFN